jgi:hypothetical protein
VSAERYVVLGLAHVRAGWFSEVSRWSTSGVAPVEFVKCVSIDEVRSRLASGRPVSALLLDAQRTGVDRDLLDAARTAGAAAIVVGDGRRNWVALGAAAQLPATFGRTELLDVLRANATVIGAPGGAAEPVAPVVDGGWRGRLVAVTGAGGTGTSTVAMALAQGLATDPRNLGLVCLADLALDADLAMFHDARDVVPGVQELVEAFRSGTPEPDAVRAMTFPVTDRGYHLLLGLRNHRDWTAVRPRSFDAALDALRRTFRVVVADIDDDLEGQERTGSIDVEERNLFARRTSALADLVVVTGEPTTKGVHALVRSVHRLVEHGVDPGRLLPVVNHAPRSPRRRAELARAVAQLTGPTAHHGLAGPVFLVARRGLDDLVNQSAPLPWPLVRMVTAAVAGVLDTAAWPAAAGPSAASGERVVPGTLGAWADAGTGTGTGTGTGEEAAG